MKDSFSSLRSNHFQILLTYKESRQSKSLFMGPPLLLLYRLKIRFNRQGNHCPLRHLAELAPLARPFCRRTGLRTGLNRDVIRSGSLYTRIIGFDSFLLLHSILHHGLRLSSSSLTAYADADWSQYPYPD